MAQPGFFDLDNRYESLSHLGDPLEVLDRAIPWETFRPVLNKALHKFKKSNAGRKPYDPVLMFKILVLQSLYNLSDDQTEFQIKDRSVTDRSAILSATLIIFLIVGLVSFFGMFIYKTPFSCFASIFPLITSSGRLNDFSNELK